MTEKNNILTNTNEKQSCCGCSACAVICPVKAVNMTLSDNGFWIPTIDDAKCVSCGLCKSVCYKFHNKAVYDVSNGTLFAAQSNNSNIVKKSSSGGIAFELSKYAIENDFSVCGVVYDYEKHKATNIIAENINTLSQLCGSKYLQSYTADAYDEMVNQATDNMQKKFLVFGTPCQIFGLNKVLEKKKLRENFILVDLFCHGVPSYLVWDSYLDYVKAGKNIDKISYVNFRNKESGWHMYTINVGNDTTLYSSQATDDLFYNAFFENVLLNKSCLNCSFRNNQSAADIKLGDFWGERYSKREDGVSAVILLSKRGKNFFEGCKDINIIDTHETSECLGAQYSNPYYTDSLHKMAFDKLKQTKDLKKTIKYYRSKFPLKKRVIYLIKTVSSFVPSTLKVFIKKVIKKI